jgi:uncharacterized membrane protein
MAAYSAPIAELASAGRLAGLIATAKTRTREGTSVAAVAAMVVLWAATFTWLSVIRHLAGGTHAEDLGFHDQVLSNFLRGQWFRMSIYNGATWDTELDFSRIARPDSLFAFHVEPILLLLLPVYALCGGAIALLIVQAVAMGAGAFPAYRLGRYFGGSPITGLAVATAYLLSPLGQWAVLDDFHTSVLAAPLLILSFERLLVGHAPGQALLAAAVAVTAREDVGPAVALLGLVLLVQRRRVGAPFVVLGVTSSILCALLIRSFSGGVHPLDMRYGPTLGSGLGPALSALERPTVIHYAMTLLLSGGWLSVLSPLALLPAVPSLALNVLSASPWMAAGKAHYSVLVLPFVTVGAAAAVRRLRDRPRARATISGALVVTSLIGYLVAGSGPFGADYAPAALSAHSAQAATIASSLPTDAAVSATSSLVPRVSRRSRVYVFPAVLDADYAFLDLQASPGPTSAGDVYLRVQEMLASGEWVLRSADDGLILLRRTSEATAAEPAAAVRRVGQPEASLVSAELVPSPDGALGFDGPRWILRTTWRTDALLATGARLEFLIDLDTGEQLHVWDVADLWWNPPERWVPGQPVTIDVPDVPMRHFKSWQARWSRE